MGGETTGTLLELVRAYDRCWVERRPGDLRQFLHPHVVFAGPQFERLVQGIDACVQSYVGFTSEATVHRFEPSDYVVDVTDDAVAVVTYRWTIDYEFQGARSVESGGDLQVWMRQGDRWLVAWRSQRPDAP